ncbi:MAG: hypothetical protein ACPGJS_21600 [Flammeovirgaceae bacterium]
MSSWESLLAQPRFWLNYLHVSAETLLLYAKHDLLTIDQHQALLFIQQHHLDLALPVTQPHLIRFSFKTQNNYHLHIQFDQNSQYWLLDSPSLNRKLVLGYADIPILHQQETHELLRNLRFTNFKQARFNALLLYKAMRNAPLPKEYIQYMIGITKVFKTWEADLIAQYLIIADNFETHFEWQHHPTLGWITNHTASPRNPYNQMWTKQDFATWKTFIQDLTYVR